MTDEKVGRGRKGWGRRRGSSNLGDLVKAEGSGSKSPDERHLEAPQPWPKRPGPLNTGYRERGGSESSKTLDVRKLRPFVHRPAEILKTWKMLKSRVASGGHLDCSSSVY